MKTANETHTHVRACWGGRADVYKYNPSPLPTTPFLVHNYCSTIKRFYNQHYGVCWDISITAMAETSRYSSTHNIYIEIHPTAITATHLSLKRLGLYVLITSPISLLFIQYFDSWPKQLYAHFSGVAGLWSSLRQSENNTDNYRPMPSVTAHARDKCSY